MNLNKAIRAHIIAKFLEGEDVATIARWLPGMSVFKIEGVIREALRKQTAEPELSWQEDSNKRHGSKTGI